MQTYTTRNFTDNVAEALRASCAGPVIITACGEPAHVLLSFEQYKALTGEQKNIHQLLAMPCMDEIDVNFDRIDGDLRQPDFS